MNPTSWLYDGAGRARKTTNPDGTAVVYSYDQAGRQIAMTELDDTGATVADTDTGYDPAGNMISETSARGHDTIYGIDAMGRLTSVTQPVDDTMSITTSYAYDAGGNMTRHTDGEGFITRRVYNEWGLETHVLEPSATVSPVEPETGRVWVNTYDAAGRATGATEPGSRTITRTFNAMGLPETETWVDPNAANTTKAWGYDRAGRMTWGSHPDTPITVTYDDRGLQVASDGGAGTSRTIHDQAGRVISRDDDAGTTTFAYDTNGQPDTATDTGSGGGGGGGGGSTEILFVVRDPASLRNGESAVQTHLVNDGWTVTLADDGTTVAADADGKAAVLISQVVIGSAIGDEFAATSTPVMVWKPGLYDDMGLVANSSDYGTTTTQTQIDIADPNHPIATGLTGTVTVYTAAKKTTWGHPAQDADIIATTPGVPNDVTIFAYDTGDTLADNTTANGRRVGFYLGTNGAKFATTDGWTLFDNTIDWLTADQGGGGGEGWSIDYTHDNSGRLTGIGYADGGTRAYTYDVAGRVDTDTLTNASAVQTAQVDYDWDCEHNLIYKTLDLDTNTENGDHAYTYDWAGRLTSWDNNPTQTPPVCPQPGGGGGGGGGGAGGTDVMFVSTSTPYGHTEDKPVIAFLENDPTSPTQPNVNHFPAAANTNGMGLNVTVFDQSVTEADSAGYDLIVVSDTTWAMDGRFKDTAIPVLTWQAGIYDDMNLTGDCAGDNCGGTGTWNGVLDIADPNHPMAAGLAAGEHTVLNTAAEAFRFGVPDPSADVVAYQKNQPTKPVLFGYDTDDYLVTTPPNTTNPAARRVGFWWSKIIPSTSANATAWDTFEAS
ncbi:MAG: RHS repeat protein, partial [Hyphomicrobiales bacterium]|nr:RHS repeat protein [Hyphomicrobiales bacterium]